MCGISGFVDYSKQLDQNTIHSMIRVQSHRGPDSNGFKTFSKDIYSLSLQHNRLAIIDLSPSGYQPMSFGKYHIIFNGEIYNYKEIRKQLSGKYTFVGESDTEVILKAFDNWGKACVEHFHGMFSIVIYDEEAHKLHLWRDRFGVKPLYYYWSQDLFAFSSELKTLLAHPKIEPKEDLFVAHKFFQFGYVPDTNAIYNNIQKVQPSEYIEINLNTKTFKKEKYWLIPTSSTFLDNEETVLQQLEQELEDAIRLRLVADVPVGLFLSGGIDSSLVASIVQKKIGADISAYTIEFEDNEFNEGEAAKKIARHLGIKHHSYLCTEKDMLDFIQEKFFFHYDEPFGDASALPTFMVSKLAKQHVKVVLSGDAGDEVFCGYSKYFYLNTIYNFNPILQNSLKILMKLFGENALESLTTLLPEKYVEKNFKYKFIKLKNSLGRIKSIEDAFYYASMTNSTDFLAAMFKAKLSSNKLNFTNDYLQQDILFKMMNTDLVTYLPGDVLVKVDRATMACGLEAREPLLDHKLVEFSRKIKPELIYKNSKGKYLLREILSKYLPRDFYERPKSGFSIPLDRWLKTKLKNEVYDLVGSRIFKDNDIFNHKRVIQELDRYFSGKSNCMNFVWYLYVYLRWKQS